MVKRVESRVVSSEPLSSGPSRRHKEPQCTSISREVIQCSDPAEDGPSYDGKYRYPKGIPFGLVIDFAA